MSQSAACSKYERMVATRRMRLTEEQAAELFTDKSGGPDACWPWTGGKSAGGYGMFRKVYAHRAAYEAAHGAVPDGLIVCHRCDNKPCCNPAHLYAGTYADNARDAVERGQWKKPPDPWASGMRQRGPQGTRCKRGHEYDRRSRQGWMVCGVCVNDWKRARRASIRAALTAA